MSSIINRDSISPENAIKNSQLKELKNLISYRRIDKTWHEASTGRGLLHLAAASNQVEIVNFLIGECRVDINAQDSDGNTALHLAVISSHLKATRAILSHKPNDTLCNKDCLAPLHIAIKQGAQSIKIVSEFIQHPTVNLFVKGDHDYTSLHVIAETNNLKALQLIHGESLAKMQHQDSSFCKFLMTDKNSLTAFHLAARAGSYEVLAFMLSKCSDRGSSVRSLSGDCRTPLHYAIEGGHVECVRVLLEHGGDPMAMSGHHPPLIHLACIYNQVNVVKLMVDMFGKGILQSRDQEGRTTLHSSTVSFYSCDLISYLVENSVSINGDRFERIHSTL